MSGRIHVARAVELSDRPRILEVDLTALDAGRDDARSERAWRGSTPALDRVGRWSGSALSTALLLELDRAHPGEPAPLVLSVGDCVRRGVPTAARVSIASRAPLTGRLSEGQVGSDLARRLARVADALVLRGRAPGAVLVIERDGALALHRMPELVGLSSREVHAALLARWGPCATLSVGAAGERELPLASLAAGGDPPHFVGRGGLGAVFGRLGLKALIVRAEPIAANAVPQVIAALLASPRIEARAMGGTLELFGALGARDELAARNYAEPIGRERAAALETAVATARDTRHGCTGCPTPCGWTFRIDLGRAQAARFGATHALGLNLGLERFEDALTLLARCDELGLDAKEVGALLALACRARELGICADAPRWGERDELLRALDDLLDGRGLGERMRHGAAHFARELGLEREHFGAKGSALRPDASLASVLGQCVSSRGADPMRTFPFLASDGVARERLTQLTGLPMPEGAQDPRAPAGKGRLVWWHENLSAALDATGFCAFSAAALLADGSVALDELARWLAPEWARREPDFEGAPGAALLAAGEALVGLQRELDQRWAPGADGDRPEWARSLLDLPGMWDEYARLRGLDERGRMTSATRLRLERGEPNRPAFAPEPAAAASAPGPSPGRKLGRVTLLGNGVIARELGPRSTHTLALPATWREVVATLARGLGDSGRVLARDGRTLPSAYRQGARLDENELVRDGDEIDLVLVVSGG